MMSCAECVQEQGAEENILTEEAGRDRTMQKVAY